MDDSLPNFNFPEQPEATEPQPPKRQKPKPVRTAKKRGPKPGFKRKARAVAPAQPLVRRYVVDKASGKANELSDGDFKAIKYLSGLSVERRAMIIMVANGLAK